MTKTGSGRTTEGAKMELKYEVTIQLIGGHKPVEATAVEIAVEKAIDAAVIDLLDPDDIDVAVEEA